ncbi:MAG: hypothetical protein WBN22_00980 [Verrucomicrobiia bacterium]
MKTYQAQLPLRNHRIVTPVPLPPRHPLPPAPPSQSALSHRIKRFIEDVLLDGYWFCNSCDMRCERLEGEQGQPAHCHRCNSPRIEWIPPIDQRKQPEAP